MNIVNLGGSVLLTHINNHGDEHDQTEPRIEGGCKINDSYQDIRYSRKNVKEEIAQQTVYRVCSTTDNAQHFTRFSA